MTKLALAALAGLLCLSPATAVAQLRESPAPYANRFDREKEAVFAERAADWRNGAVVYQVIVDRFAPPADLEAKRHLYPAPKTLRSWEEVPGRGTYREDVKVWSHEIDFWGGDLDSLSTKLDYIAQLGVDVLYLNPIHLAYTNHKYDAQDYFEVSPEYGTRADVGELARDVHAAGMKFMLDGVLNHMGRTSPMFVEALAAPDSKWRDWFVVSPDLKMGYRGWYNVANLPELNLESTRVRERLWGAKDSAVVGYLREGVDGWRLDVAYDIGFTYLRELTDSAHRYNPESLVIGELWNYPEEWSDAVDGTMNMTARELILQLVRGQLSPALAGRHFERMVADCDFEYLLRSWIIIDNHDTPRLRHVLPERWAQKLAQVLQFTLPGSPCVYYGVELGMEGGDDPEQRGPMRWDLATADNEYFTWMKQLIALRKDNPALRHGDFRLLDSENLLAFIRTTNTVRDHVLVVANPTDKPLTDCMMLRDSKIMSYTLYRDALGTAEARAVAGTITITVPPRTIHVFLPEVGEGPEYSPYKRVQ
jgi:glycosidase